MPSATIMVSGMAIQPLHPYLSRNQTSTNAMDVAMTIRTLNSIFRDENSPIGRSKSNRACFLSHF